MDDTILAFARQEEAELLRKLKAVRELLDAYGVTRTMDEAVATGQPLTRKQQKPRARGRSTAYGEHIISTVLHYLPDAGMEPMKTRDLLRAIEAEGVEVRGKNKVSSLSALLGRTKQITGFGRRGWTKANQVVTDSDSVLSNDSGFQQGQMEKGPASESAVGSDTGQEGAPPPTNPFVQPSIQSAYS